MDLISEIGEDIATTSEENVAEKVLVLEGEKNVPAPLQLCNVLSQHEKVASTDSPQVWNPTQTPVSEELLPQGCYIYQCQNTMYRITTYTKTEPVPRKPVIQRPGHAYPCNVEGCGRQFSTPSYLKVHQLVHNGEKSLTCSYDGCNRKFAWPAHLKYHQLTHMGKRSFTCTVLGCEKSFYTSQRLDVHTRMHTGERPFVCRQDGCNKAFTTAGNLKNHARIHSGDKPFVCDHEGCVRCFTEFSSLRKHKLIHSGQKPFQCQVCCQQFTQSGSRNVHMKKHHSGSPLITTALVKYPVQTTTAADKPAIIVISGNGEDFQFTDQVVTVSTEPQSANFQGSLDLSNAVLSSQSTNAVLNSQDDQGNAVSLSADSSLRDSTANVVVLSQPQDMVTITSFHDNQDGANEEIVYDCDLLDTTGPVPL